MGGQPNRQYPPSKATSSKQKMNSQSITLILSNLKSLVGDEAFNQSLSAMGQKKVKKLSESKVVGAEGAHSSASAQKAFKPPSAWNTLVTQTLADMKQSGWPSWTDAKGAVWPASRPSVVLDKKGVKVSDFVYDGGEHDGKAPTPALGGMVRASHLKGPSASASAKASDNGSVTSEKKKGGRPKMTEAQKAEAKLKRDIKKAAAAVNHTEGLSGGWAELASGKVDLSFYKWEHDGKQYIKNDRGDVIEAEEGVWVGRFNGSAIESIPEPSDLDGVEMRA